MHLDPLDALEAALAAERRALLDNDAEALFRSTADKVAALRRAEAMQPDPAMAGRIEALRAANYANAVLLARRRREIAWALRHLGRVESTPVYTAAGHANAIPQARALGVG